MIRINEIWLATQPMDMRAGIDTAMAQIMKTFGSIKPHCAYLFCNKRGHRMKVLLHDGLGIWLCARRLEQGKFHWAKIHQGETMSISAEQLQALIQGLPWQRMDDSRWSQCSKPGWCILPSSKRSISSAS